MILDDIVAKRKEQLQREISLVSRNEIKRLANNTNRPTISFYNALKKDGLSVIAEVKKASPSKSVIKDDFNPIDIAMQYEKAGANAISCLTEEHYFQGNSTYLSQIRENVNLPILRKDFIIDEYQIYEARVIGADAILLIAAILPIEKIIEFYKIAHRLNLDCLTEVHNKNELSMAIKAKCNIIGINNRNLKTFDVDIKNTEELSKLVPKECLLVSESGITNNDDMKNVRKYGADAVLIGETLMRSNDIISTMQNLREGL